MAECAVCLEPLSSASPYEGVGLGDGAAQSPRPPAVALQPASSLGAPPSPTPRLHFLGPPSSPRARSGPPARAHSSGGATPRRGSGGHGDRGGNVVTLNCGHSHHAACLRLVETHRWASSAGRAAAGSGGGPACCPLCRAPFTPRCPPALGAGRPFRSRGPGGGGGGHLLAVRPLAPLSRPFADHVASPGCGRRHNASLGCRRYDELARLEAAFTAAGYAAFELRPAGGGPGDPDAPPPEFAFLTTFSSSFSVTLRLCSPDGVCVHARLVYGYSRRVRALAAAGLLLAPAAAKRPRCAALEALRADDEGGGGAAAGAPGLAVRWRVSAAGGGCGGGGANDGAAETDAPFLLPPPPPTAAGAAGAPRSRAQRGATVAAAAAAGAAAAPGPAGPAGSGGAPPAHQAAAAEAEAWFAAARDAAAHVLQLARARRAPPLAAKPGAGAGGAALRLEATEARELRVAWVAEGAAGRG